MSLIGDLYTERMYLDDLAKCEMILTLAREGVADKTMSGLRLNELATQNIDLVRGVKAKWAANAKWFGALAKAKRDWALRVFGEHDSEVLKRLSFLKFVVKCLKEGTERPAERRIEMPSGDGPWARERSARSLQSGFMPDCEFEICTGGRWMPVTKQDLPDKVRWV